MWLYLFSGPSSLSGNNTKSPQPKFISLWNEKLAIKLHQTVFTNHQAVLIYLLRMTQQYLNSCKKQHDFDYQDNAQTRKDISTETHFTSTCQHVAVKSISLDFSKTFSIKVASGYQVHINFLKITTLYSMHCFLSGLMVLNAADKQSNSLLSHYCGEYEDFPMVYTASHVRLRIYNTDITTSVYLEFQYQPTIIPFLSPSQAVLRSRSVIGRYSQHTHKIAMTYTVRGSFFQLISLRSLNRTTTTVFDGPWIDQPELVQDVSTGFVVFIVIKPTFSSSFTFHILPAQSQPLLHAISDQETIFTNATRFVVYHLLPGTGLYVRISDFSSFKSGDCLRAGIVFMSLASMNNNSIIGPYCGVASWEEELFDGLLIRGSDIKTAVYSYDKTSFKIELKAIPMTGHNNRSLIMQAGQISITDRGVSLHWTRYSKGDYQCHSIPSDVTELMIIPNPVEDLYNNSNIFRLFYATNRRFSFSTIPDLSRFSSIKTCVRNTIYTKTYIFNDVETWVMKKTTAHFTDDSATFTRRKYMYNQCVGNERVYVLSIAQPSREIAIIRNKNEININVDLPRLPYALEFELYHRVYYVILEPYLGVYYIWEAPPLFLRCSTVRLLFYNRYEKVLGLKYDTTVPEKEYLRMHTATGEQPKVGMVLGKRRGQDFCPFTLRLIKFYRLPYLNMFYFKAENEVCEY